ncbi:MAG: hypothetical protein AAF417_20560 [Pseudomonadota bacterium]
MRKSNLVISALVGTVTAGSVALGDATLDKVDNRLQVRDLANLAGALGVGFELFDYELDDPHCIHFFVDETAESDRIRHDGHGLCGLGGRHRLTVQWKVENEQVQVRFMRYRRDIEQGVTITGPSFPAPASGGFTEYAIDRPQLDYDRETVLFHGAFGQNQGPRTEFKVLAELRPNPSQTVGTE